jgi:hypothetical protein
MLYHGMIYSNIKKNKTMKQTQTTLTLEQQDLLDKCTTGKWTVNSKTGLVDIRGRFDCYNKGLTSFEGIRFGTVTGNFDCDNNSLTSLDGAPQKAGEFSCANNLLTSLKGAPQEVVGVFRCSNNKLKTLEGAPATVGAEFDCSTNQLTSLKGAPQEVGADFNCSFNNLNSLAGAPRKVVGIFNCASNKLTTLEGGPVEVGLSFVCTSNQLTTLTGAPEKVGANFYCARNPLKSMDGGPKKLGGEIVTDPNYGRVYVKESYVKMFEQFINEKYKSPHLNYDAMAEFDGLTGQVIQARWWIDTPKGEREVIFWCHPSEWFDGSGIPEVYYEPDNYTKAERDEIERVIADMHAGGGGVGLSLLGQLQKAADKY